MKKQDVQEKEKKAYSEWVYCPECGAKLVPAEGCLLCPFCGWSKCK